MRLFGCPKCPYVSKPQPDHVTGMTHQCNPNIPRAYRLRLIPQPTPQGDTPT